jgi:hypothetical protein
VSEALPHWNEEVPGIWCPLRTVKGVGSYIGKYVRPQGGVYRLIALADVELRTPMVINRVCGRDETGTLYIGVAARTLRLRLQQLMRSLRRPPAFRFRLKPEHHVGDMIRSNRLLEKMLPRECLAVTWAYEKRPWTAEEELISQYLASFGELPPLNTMIGGASTDPPEDLPELR